MSDREPDVGDDPFEQLSLDEDFVRQAWKHEPTAQERARRAALVPPADDQPPDYHPADDELADDELAARRQVVRRSRRPHRRMARRARRWFRLRTMVGILLLAALGTVAVSSILERPVASGPPPNPVAWISGPPLNMTADAGRPTPKPEESTQPIGHPPPGNYKSLSYKFMFTQPGGDQPVAYDPCRRISVVINQAQAPPGGTALIHEALDEVSARTGLQFVVEGLTGEVPVQNRPAFQPDHYGDRWAPVLMAWTDPQHFPALAGDVAGIGGSTNVRVGIQPTVYVSGMVALDGPQLGSMLEDPGGRAEVLSVILHETGHLVGLDHSTDPKQLMNAQGHATITKFQAGDIAGLARLGSGTCVGPI